MKYASGNKRVFTITILTYGKDVTMSSRTQATDVLLRWKYVRQQGLKNSEISKHVHVAYRATEKS